MSSLPVPLSPQMQTLASPAATFSMREKRSSSFAERPTMPWNAVGVDAGSALTAAAGAE